MYPEVFFMNETINNILSRSSIRKYEVKPLEPQQLQWLKQCALASPSAKNKMPWQFIFVNNPQVIEQFEQLMKVYLSESEDIADQKAAQEPTYSLFYQAPCIVVVAVSDHEHMPLIDCGIAVENLALCAQSMGLSSVIVGRPRVLFASRFYQEISDLLQFPKNYQFGIAIAIGTKATQKDPHTLDWSKITEINS